MRRYHTLCFFNAFCTIILCLKNHLHLYIPFTFGVCFFWKGIFHFLRKYIYDIPFLYTFSPWRCSYESESLLSLIFFVWKVRFWQKKEIFGRWNIFLKISLSLHFHLSSLIYMTILYKNLCQFLNIAYLITSKGE